MYEADKLRLIFQGVELVPLPSDTFCSHGDPAGPACDACLLKMGAISHLPSRPPPAAARR